MLRINSEKDNPKPGESFEEIKRSLEELRDQWNYMHEAMRHDLRMQD
jgi:hypothetical protein